MAKLSKIQLLFKNVGHLMKTNLDEIFKEIELNKTLAGNVQMKVKQTIRKKYVNVYVIVSPPLLLVFENKEDVVDKKALCILNLLHVTVKLSETRKNTIVLQGKDNLFLRVGFDEKRLYHYKNLCCLCVEQSEVSKWLTTIKATVDLVWRVWGALISAEPFDPSISENDTSDELTSCSEISDDMSEKSEKSERGGQRVSGEKDKTKLKRVVSCEIPELNNLQNVKRTTNSKRKGSQSSGNSGKKSPEELSKLIITTSCSEKSEKSPKSDSFEQTEKEKIETETKEIVQKYETEKIEFLTTIEELKNKLQEKEEHYTKTKMDTQKTISDLQNLVMSRERLSEEVEKIRMEQSEELMRLKKEIEKTPNKTEIEKMQKVNEINDNKIMELQAEITKMREKALKEEDDFKQVVEIMKQENVELKDEIEVMKVLSKTMSENMTQMNGDLEAFKTEEERSKIEIERLTALVAEKENEIIRQNDLIGKLSDEKEKLQTIKHNNIMSEKVITEYKEKIANLENERSTIIAEIEYLRNKEETSKKMSESERSSTTIDITNKKLIKSLMCVSLYKKCDIETPVVYERGVMNLLIGRSNVIYCLLESLALEECYRVFQSQNERRNEKRKVSLGRLLGRDYVFPVLGEVYKVLYKVRQNESDEKREKNEKKIFGIFEVVSIESDNVIVAFCLRGKDHKSDGQIVVYAKQNDTKPDLRFRTERIEERIFGEQNDGTNVVTTQVSERKRDKDCNNYEIYTLCQSYWTFLDEQNLFGEVQRECLRGEDALPRYIQICKKIEEKKREVIDNLHFEMKCGTWRVKTDLKDTETSNGIVEVGGVIRPIPLNMGGVSETTIVDAFEDMKVRMKRCEGKKEEEKVMDFYEKRISRVGFVIYIAVALIVAIVARFAIL
ncbi:hypothetical protein EIN_341370 [Entamoeba invadens IP1]|uniref:PH domain-containing protein n=1 Tax=Entamoeba invadens IP1 TaxID=370355 RepID=A0A0A1UDT9_ENTIV|nr:hypothetical protein EIN_341370 [Entamoeba invadens IP1]ELP94759.1 hypothetical protein EIN_341370 [Entamoeba invadens IP1]|eukprot:XP_004261530.1 hypothetical protein EIN_341370 [Entamoeba invadens IP1]